MIYLDNAASTPCCTTARIAMWEAYAEYGNIHRGIHRYSERTTAAYEAARDKVARFIGAERDEIIFTSGTTDSINLLARAWEHNIEPGDEIVVTILDHDSNRLPWEQLAKRRGAKLRVVSLGPDFEPYFWPHITERTKIVAFPVVSNVLGTGPWVEEVVELAHQHGAIVVADAAQSIAHYTHDVREMGVDFMAFSGHKMYGPTGIGVLYAKHQARMKPVEFGGGANVFEVGTPPIAQAIGLGAAIDYLQENRALVQSEYALTNYAYMHLREHVNILGPMRRGSLISFAMDYHPHDVATLLDDRGIAVRAGYHCAKPLHQALGIPGSVRVSFSFTNTTEEIDRLVDALDEVKSILR